MCAESGKCVCAGRQFVVSHSLNVLRRYKKHHGIRTIQQTVLPSRTISPFISEALRDAAGCVSLLLCGGGGGGGRVQFDLNRLHISQPRLPRRPGGTEQLERLG